MLIFVGWFTNFRILFSILDSDFPLLAEYCLGYIFNIISLFKETMLHAPCSFQIEPSLQNIESLYL